MNFYKNVGCHHNYVLTRTIHPVGQGLFCQESFSCDGSTFFTAIYDCGGCISASKRYNGYDGIVKYIDALNVIDKIDVIFISHFHFDHTNGIFHLLKKHVSQNTRIYIPRVSTCQLFLDYVYNIRVGGFANEANRFIEEYVLSDSDARNVRVVVAEAGAEENVYYKKNNDAIWKYTIEPTIGGDICLETIVAKLCEIMKIDSPSRTKEYFCLLSEKLRESELLNQVINIYKTMFHNQHNFYSMPVFSAPQHHRNDVDYSCLYTGDAPADRLVFLLEKYQPAYFQIPHHGSSHNFSENLYYKHMTSFVSFGEDNPYHHPGISELNYILSVCNRTFLVTENPKTKFFTEVLCR